MEFLTIIKSEMPITIEEVHFKTGLYYEEICKCTALALFHYEKAIAIKPSHIEAHFGLGRVKESLDDLNGALESLDKAMRYCRTETGIVVDNVQRYFNQLLIRKRKYLETKIKKNEGTAVDMMELGELIWRRFGNEKSGKKYIEQAMNMGDVSIDVFLTAVGMAEDMFEYELCFEYALKGLECFPEEYYLNYIVAEYYSEKEQYESAIVHYKKCVQVYAESGSYIYEYIANAYSSIENDGQAKIYYGLALSLNPDNEGTKEILSSFGDGICYNGLN